MGDTKVVIINSNGVAVTIGEAIHDLNIQLDQRIARSSQTAEAGELLKELSRRIEQVAKSAGDSNQDHIQSMMDNLDAVSKQVDRPRPDKEWYKLSLSKIADAAKAIGEIAKPVLEIIAKLTPILLS